MIYLALTHGQKIHVISNIFFHKCELEIQYSPNLKAKIQREVHVKHKLNSIPMNHQYL
jgi:hypothetical protein